MKANRMHRWCAVILPLSVILSACTRATPIAPTSLSPTSAIATSQPEVVATNIPDLLPTTIPSSSTPAVQPEPAAWVPLDAEACAELAAQATASLHVLATSESADFHDPIGEGIGKGCQIVATGTGATFADPWSTATQLKQMLIVLGWREDVRYVADGPMGTAAGFRKGNALCVLYVGWKPSDDARVDRDKPVSEWNLTPEQKIFTVRLHCASEIAPPQP